MKNMVITGANSKEDIATPLSGTISTVTFKKFVRAGKITYAGNAKLKIYGRLDCASGKRMKKANRIFFSSEDEAVRYGFRPCGHCLRSRYRLVMTSWPQFV